MTLGVRLPGVSWSENFCYILDFGSVRIMQSSWGRKAKATFFYYCRVEQGEVHDCRNMLAPMTESAIWFISKVIVHSIVTAKLQSIGNRIGHRSSLQRQGLRRAETNASTCRKIGRWTRHSTKNLTEQFPTAFFRHSFHQGLMSSESLCKQWGHCCLQLASNRKFCWWRENNVKRGGSEDGATSYTECNGSLMSPCHSFVRRIVGNKLHKINKNSTC